MGPGLKTDQGGKERSRGNFKDGRGKGETTINLGRTLYDWEKKKRAPRHVGGNS